MADELDALSKAANGLLYPSDTDSPFDLVSWPAAVTARDALMSQAKPVGAVEEVPLDKFFAELSDSDDAARFMKLKQAINSALSDAKVLRAGKTTVDVYIIGKTKSGKIGGLHTKSVET